MPTPFFKMTGSGNDFVFLDGRVSPLGDWPAERIAAACHRRFGIGADGLVVLEPTGADAVRMHYFNADGGRAALCGNASLCTTRLSARLGLAQAEGMAVHTDAGVLQTRCVGPGHMAEIRLPSFRAATPIQLGHDPGGPGRAWFGDDIGVPHLVVLVDDVAGVDVLSRGRALRSAPEVGPQGTNVNFVGQADGPEGREWRIRTYERGVEGETLACASGTISAAFALAREGLARLPIRFRAGSGAILSVAGQVVDGEAQEVWLCGEGRLVFEGAWEG